MSASKSSGSFWSNLFRTRERFSLEELGHLVEVLDRHPVVNDSNKETIVETLRSIAELMIWGDQHDQHFFDFFLEHQVLGYFQRILVQKSSRSGGIAVQLLQTLSIMIQNIRSDTAVYYIFSSAHINDLISYQFDFDDEELLAYYISFLKTISMKLNTKTIQFFFHRGAGDDTERSFPLYTEAIKFFQHSESMVRAAVRTLTLQVYSVDDEDVQNFVMGDMPGAYFAQLSDFVRDQCLQMWDLLPRVAPPGASAAAPGSASFGRAKGQLEGVLTEIADLLCYCNDILSLRRGPLAAHLVDSLWDALAENVLFLPLLEMYAPGGEEDGGAAASRGRALCALHLLSRVLHHITHPPLLDAVVSVLLLRPEHAVAHTPLRLPRAPVLSPMVGGGHGWGNEVGVGGGGGGLAAAIPSLSLGANAAAGGGRPAEGRGGGAEEEEGEGGRGGGGDGASTSSSEGDPAGDRARGGGGSDDGTGRRGSVVDAEDVNVKIDGGGGGGGGGGAGGGGMKGRGVALTVQPPSPPAPGYGLEGAALRAALVGYVAGGDRMLAAAALRVLVSLVQCRAASKGVLGAAGVLPRASRQSARLLAALTSPTEGAGGDDLFPASPPLLSPRGKRAAGAGPGGGGRDAGGDAGGDGVPGEGEDEDEGGDLAEAILVLLACEPRLPAPQLWHGCWLLTQLLPPPPSASSSLVAMRGLTPQQRGQLEACHASAADGVRAELLGGCCSDIVLPMVVSEWDVAARAFQGPSLAGEGVAVLTAAPEAPVGAGMMAGGAGGGAPPRPGSSAAAALATGAAVRSFVALEHARRRLSGIGGGGACPLAGVREALCGPAADVREGSEVELDSTGAGALPCRVAFARGVERSVYLSVTDPATGGSSVLLSDPAPMRLGAGVVLAMAPLAGVDPYVDRSHPSWLHLRVRAPPASLLAASGVGSFPRHGDAARKLADGFWTLAFSDGERAGAAKSLIDGAVARLRQRCLAEMAPLLDPPRPPPFSPPRSPAPVPALAPALPPSAGLVRGGGEAEAEAVPEAEEAAGFEPREEAVPEAEEAAPSALEHRLVEAEADTEDADGGARALHAGAEGAGGGHGGTWGEEDSEGEESGDEV